MKPIKQLCPRFESLRAAQQRQLEFHRALERGISKERDIARVLGQCTEERRCCLAFCPVCVRHLRRSYVRGAVGCIEQILSAAQVQRLPLTRFSAIPIGDSHRAPIGQLDSLKIENIYAATHRALQRLDLPVVFAGLDISLNEDGRSRWKPYWQIHLYGVVIYASPNRVRQILEPLFPPDRRAPRPLMVSRCDDLAGAVSYSLKPYFSRRVSYVDETGRRNTRTCPLRANDLREVACLLSRLKIEHRYLLIGCRRSKDKISLNDSGYKKLKAQARRK